MHGRHRLGPDRQHRRSAGPQRPVTDNLKSYAAAKSANRFPGLDNEIQGLYRETDAKGVVRYFTYVVRE